MEEKVKGWSIGGEWSIEMRRRGLSYLILFLGGGGELFTSFYPHIKTVYQN